MTPFTVTEQDLRPLDRFALHWRWTDERYDVLIPDELARIRPLSLALAHLAWERSQTWHTSASADPAPSGRFFEAIEYLDSPDTTGGQKWLERRLPTASVQMVVSWQPDLAVLTDTALFARRWGSFCYPSSDDVDAWPLDYSWVVTYWHEGRLYYGQCRRRQVSARTLG